MLFPRLSGQFFKTETKRLSAYPKYGASQGLGDSEKCVSYGLPGDTCNLMERLGKLQDTKTCAVPHWLQRRFCDRCQVTHTNDGYCGVPRRVCAAREVGGWREAGSMVSLCPSSTCPQVVRGSV